MAIERRVIEAVARNLQQFGYPDSYSRFGMPRIGIGFEPDVSSVKVVFDMSRELALELAEWLGERLS